jgi:hypothetical protein
VLLALPGGATAQGGAWPTLSGAGLEYISRSGGVQVTFSGQLDVEAMHVTNSWSSLVSLEGGSDVLRSVAEDCSECHTDEPLGSVGGGIAAHRLRLFMDVFLGDHVYSLVEVRTDHGQSPTSGRARGRVEQAYVRLSTTQGTWGVQAGLFASPLGAYALRHLSVADPFLRPPLAYDYRTLMNRTVVPSDPQALLGWRDSPEAFRRPGAPPVWDVPYQWGGMLFGKVAGLGLSVAAMNSAPSSAPDVWGFDWSRMDDPSWTVAARGHPAAGVEMGASWTRGPWMEAFTSGSVQPTGGAAGPAPGYRDFDQEVVSADLSVSRGATVVRLEAMLDRWAVPNLPDRPTERLYTVEVQRDLAAGVFVAARLGHIDFRPLTGTATSPTGGAVDWDADVTRYEASLGYRLARNAGLLLSAYEQVQRDASDAAGRLVGLRLWWGF